MEMNFSEALETLALLFLRNNYDYVWLKTMIEKAHTVSSNGATLITGSSLALNGIEEGLWHNAINCSMHSQDLYYDFLCAKKVITDQEIGSKFTRCFIILAYYGAFNDLSRSTIYREHWIPQVYYPIYKDSHNWENPPFHVPWTSLGEIPESLKDTCEKWAANEILKYGSYYNALRKRKSIFDMHGKQWWELTYSERLSFGLKRVANNNKGFRRYTESEKENRKILNEYVHFLHRNGITPIVVIPPFTYVYRQYMRKEIRDNMLEMVDSVPEDVHYVDFNEGTMFEPSDFMDTDHLSEKGAHKMSEILVEMFGL